MVLPTPTANKNPATAAGAGGTQNTPAVQASIPFTRASRPKSALVGQYSPVFSAAQNALAAIQVRPAGFLARLRIKVVATAAANAATVVFAADGPFAVLQQISFTSPAGETVMSNIDGFALYALNKYGAFASGTRDPLADPTYSVTAGAGGTGGSFKFMLDIPVEVDSRDAFCTLQNMAANQQFILQISTGTLAQVYTTAPTTAPTLQVTVTMEYYSAPSATNEDGIPQQPFPTGIGSLSLIQTQQPPIVPNTQQKTQLINVGNTIRFWLFILRTAGGVRTEADWPVLANLYVNNDLHFYKDKDLWRSQMAIGYKLFGGITATPTVNALDNGVYVLTDFMDGGSSGGMVVQGSSDRNQWLVTGTGTGIDFEAVPWGNAAGSLQVITNSIKPASPQAIYAPQVY